MTEKSGTMLVRAALWKYDQPDPFKIIDVPEDCLIIKWGGQYWASNGVTVTRSEINPTGAPMYMYRPSDVYMSFA